MMRDAEQYAEEDKKRREEAETQPAEALVTRREVPRRERRQAAGRGQEPRSVAADDLKSSLGH